MCIRDSIATAREEHQDAARCAEPGHPPSIRLGVIVSKRRSHASPSRLERWLAVQFGIDQDVLHGTSVEYPRKRPGSRLLIGNPSPLIVKAYVHIPIANELPKRYGAFAQRGVGAIAGEHIQQVSWRIGCGVRRHESISC